jgi:hypothetical protein
MGLAVDRSLTRPTTERNHLLCLAIRGPGGASRRGPLCYFLKIASRKAIHGSTMAETNAARATILHSPRFRRCSHQVRKVPRRLLSLSGEPAIAALLLSAGRLPGWETDIPIGARPLAAAVGDVRSGMDTFTTPAKGGAASRGEGDRQPEKLSNRPYRFAPAFH